MLTITKRSENRLDIELSGMLDAATMNAGLGDLLDKSEGISNGIMLYRIPEFTMPTLAALGVEFGYMPKLFSLIGRFKKAAVLSDAAWIRTAAEVEGAILPGIDIKAFPMDAENEAEAWLTVN